ncbi:MAG TPA: hypothetical protein PLN54_10110 [Flavobacteriales bacterium]|nr:hypothetical protein [Flavobacteriales bacterium]
MRARLLPLLLLLHRRSLGAGVLLLLPLGARAQLLDSIGLFRIRRGWW